MSKDRELEDLAVKDDLTRRGVELLTSWATAPLRQKGKAGLPTFDKMGHYGSINSFEAFQVKGINATCGVDASFVWLAQSRQLGLELNVGREVAITLLAEGRVFVTARSEQHDEMSVVGEFDISSGDGVEKSKILVTEELGKRELQSLSARSL
ncbi:hypothetical protein [Burkholderia sp. LMG 13014]|uniref:hypothetical protein n=1 Tax=Burkholderia sp. LMG 13014 TaxID=2709306 RepID=UPI0019649BBE|nr:hypothetical protein [Burkholderia sp. LMG 13014]